MTLHHSKFLIKEVVKRITVEGEHTYLMLLKQPTKNTFDDAYIELLPIMNAPH